GRSGGRAAEMEALGAVAAEPAELVELPGRLDALGDDDQSERVAELDHGADELRAVRRLVDVCHQAAVQLQEIDPAQVDDRGPAGAGVVDGQQHPGGPDRLERVDHGFRAVAVGRLGHLDAEQAGLDAGAVHRLGYQRGEVRLDELAPGEVDRHGQPAAGGAAAGLLDDPRPDRDYQARVLRHRQPPGGGQEAV